MEKTSVRLNEDTLRQFENLDTSNLRDAPIEAAYALYGKMRRAVEVLPWEVVVKSVVPVFGLVPFLCRCFFFCLSLSFHMLSPTFQVPFGRHIDEATGTPAWPIAWESYHLHLAISVLGTINMRAQPLRTNWCLSIVG